MKLNTLLRKTGLNLSFLAKKIGLSPELFRYHKRNESFKEDVIRELIQALEEISSCIEEVKRFLEKK